MSAMAATSGAFDASSSMVESGARFAPPVLISQMDDESGAPLLAWVACWAATSIGAVLFFWAAHVAVRG
jgi:hypothetical protein